MLKKKNFTDRTTERERVKQLRRILREYELIKRGTHPTLKYVQELTRSNGLSRQLLNKYLRRYEMLGEEGLLPQKRGQHGLCQNLGRDMRRV